MLRRVFNGVLQEIEQDPGCIVAVTVDRGMADPLHPGQDGLVFLVRHGPDDTDDLRHDLPQVCFLALKRHTAAFDPDQIQDIVDQFQHVAARIPDSAQIFGQLFPVVQRIQRQGRIAQNGVHGRPDIMGYIGQKDGLGIVGLAGLFQGHLQQFLAAVLLLPQAVNLGTVIIYFMKTEQGLDGNAVFPGGYTYFHAPPFAVIDRIGTVYVILLHQGLAQVLRGTHIPDPGGQFRGDSFPAVTFHEIRIPAFPEHAKGPLFAGLIDDPGPVIDQIDLIDQNVAVEKRRHNIVFRFTGTDHFDHAGKGVLSGHPQPDRDRLDMDRSAVQHLIPGPAPARPPGFIAGTIPAPAPAAPDRIAVRSGPDAVFAGHDLFAFHRIHQTYAVIDPLQISDEIPDLRQRIFSDLHLLSPSPALPRPETIRRPL